MSLDVAAFEREYLALLNKYCVELSVLVYRNGETMCLRASAADESSGGVAVRTAETIQAALKANREEILGTPRFCEKEHK